MYQYYINEGEKLAKWNQTSFSHSKRKSWTSLLPTEARCPPWSLKRQSEIMKISNTCKTFHQQTMFHLCRSTCSTCSYSQPSQRHIFLYMFQCRRLKAEPWGGLVYGVLSSISQEYQIKLPSYHHIGKCTIHTHIPDMAEVSDTASQFPLYFLSQLHPTTHLKNFLLEGKQIQVLEYATKSSYKCFFYVNLRCSWF